MTPFTECFKALRDFMLRESSGQVVASDQADTLIVRTHLIDPKTGEPGWFGMVSVRKAYVAYHLMPLDRDPELADGLSDRLTRRRHGKTCFNFKSVDPLLFEEIASLTRQVNETALVRQA